MRELFSIWQKLNRDGRRDVLLYAAMLLLKQGKVYIDKVRFN